MRPRPFSFTGWLNALAILISGLIPIAADAGSGSDYRAPRFTPDGKSIIFDWCSSDYPERCRIYLYRLESGALEYYRPPAGIQWTQGSMSADGQKLVFVTLPVGDRKRDLYSQRNEVFPNAQIAMMNIDGSDLKVLTASLGYKGMPAFSHSGKKVIFAQAERIRDSGKTVASGWDFWEVDIDSGEMQLFAGPFKFYQVGLPTYLEDDSAIIGDALGPSVNVDPDVSKMRKVTDYMRDTKSNKVHTLTRGQKMLKRPLFEGFSHTHYGSVDQHGRFFFIADNGPKEGLRVRQWSDNAQNSSWSLPMHQYHWGGAVSRDGSQFVMSGTPMDARRQDHELVILDTASGNWRKIQIPGNSEVINRPGTGQ